MAIRVSSWRAGTSKSARMIVATACVVAVADGLAAIALTFFLHDRPPIIVFQYIASGLLGPTSFSGGIATALLGILFHFLISLLWCMICFTLDQKLSQLISNKILKSVVYGTFIWTGMNLLVLPLSRVPAGAADVTSVLTGMLALILAAGLPMAYMFDQYYRKRP